MKTTRRNFALIVGAAVAAAKAPVPAPEKRPDEALQKLRDVKLKNSDEPDFTFSALAKR